MLPVPFELIEEFGVPVDVHALTLEPVITQEACHLPWRVSPYADSSSLTSRTALTDCLGHSIDDLPAVSRLLRGSPVPLVSVDLSDGGSGANERFIAFAAVRDLGVTNAGHVFVAPATMAECLAIGSVIAEFVNSEEGAFKLHVDGPGGESILHRIRTDHLADSIGRLVAVSAGFQ